METFQFQMTAVTLDPMDTWNSEAKLWVPPKLVYKSNTSIQIPAGSAVATEIDKFVLASVWKCKEPRNSQDNSSKEEQLEGITPPNFNT